MPLFTISRDGWLEYSPFQTYKLPEFVVLEEAVHGTPKAVHAPFIRAKTNEVAFTRPLYRLRWPGQGRQPNQVGGEIPSGILNVWPWQHEVPPGLVRQAKGNVPLSKLTPFLDADFELPLCVSYHLAVNSSTVKNHVGGLHAQFAQEVVDARFALNGEYRAALTYLKWLAETHWQHPLLLPIKNLLIQERIAGISKAAANLYFKLLRDCIYDPDTQWWSRGPLDWDWDKLASYMHWIGPLRDHPQAEFSGFKELPQKDTCRYVYPDNATDYTDGVPDETTLTPWHLQTERLALYRANNYNRHLSHISGKDPDEDKDFSKEDSPRWEDWKEWPGAPPFPPR